MRRHLLIGGLCMALLVLSSCQKYSGAMEQTRDLAGETVAISTLNQVAKAEMAFSVSNDGNFGSFEQLTQGGYLDSRFTSSKPVIHGYVLTLNVAPKSGSTEPSFTCNADPTAEGNNSGRHFYIDSTTTQVRANSSAVASDKDPVVQ